MATRGGRDDLETRVDELETTLAELRRELQPRRGPFGLPRPPRPREFLQFTERYALPTVIAMLEAQIRALEGLQAVLRAMDRGRDANERVDSTRERAESLGRETLAALDRTLEDLRNAVETGGLPNSPEARNLLSDAQRLTEEIESELREVPTRRDRDVEAVEEEIRILKDEFDEEDSEDRG